MTTLEQARSARAKAREIFSQFGTIAGVGITRGSDGSYGLKVNLTTRPDADASVPHDVAGVPVEIDVVGRIRSHS
jgi:hypothetical protein